MANKEKYCLSRNSCPFLYSETLYMKEWTKLLGQAMTEKYIDFYLLCLPLYWPCYKCEVSWILTEAGTAAQDLYHVTWILNSHWWKSASRPPDWSLLAAFFYRDSTTDVRSIRSLPRRNILVIIILMNF